MAKQIKGKEIIQENHLADAIASANNLLEVYKKLDDEIKKIAKNSKTKIASVTPNDIQSISNINLEVKKSNALIKESERINKEKLKLQNQLKSATDEEVKGKIRLQEATKLQKKLLSEEIALENKQLGTLKKLQIANARLRREREGLNLETKKGQQRLKEINTQLNKNNASISKYSDNLKKQKLNIGNYKSALQGAGGALKKFGAALGITAGVALLTKTIKDAVNTFTVFDQANANLASVLGTTKDKISNLTESAKEIGKTSAFTATQITSLQTELAKLGFSTDEILASTDAIQSLAQATGTDLAQSATQVGATIRAFGLEASEATRVTDVLSASTSKSALDMQKLSVALPIVAKTATVAGVSLEKTTSLLGVLADNGIDASTSATALRNIFLDLSKSGLTWDEAMAKINNSTNKNATAMELFGKRGSTVAVTLAENKVRTDELTSALEKSGGTAKSMADTQLDTLQGSVTKLSSAWEGFILSLEDGNGAFAKTIRNIIDLASEILGYISGSDDADKKTSSLAKSILLAGKVIGVLIPIIFAFNLVLAANPIGLVVLGLAALVAGIITLYEPIENLIGLWGKAFDSAENFGKAIFETGKFIFLYLTPLGLLFNALDSIFGITEALSTETEKLTDEQKKNRAALADKIDTQNRALKIGQELLDQNQKEITNAQILIDALMDENTTRDERSKIIAKLNEDYPELIGNIDLETASTAQLVNVKRELIRQILREAVEKRKSAALEEVTNRIIDAQIKLIFAKTDAQKQALQNIIKENTFAIRKINEVADLVEGNLNKVADNIDFSSNFRETNDEIDNFKKRILGLQKELQKAVANGDEQRANVIRKQISALQTQLNELENVRAKTLEDIIGKEKTTDTTADTSKSNDQFKKDSKERVEVIKKEQEEIEKIRLRGAEKEKEIDIERINKTKQNQEFYTELLTNWYKELEQKRVDNITNIVNNVKSISDTLVKSFEDVSQVLDAKLTKKIESLNGQIGESKGRIDSLSQQAQLGNLDAQQSIKAEKEALANTKLEVEKLEKKKKDLLIVVTGLNLANNLIQKGDPNAIATATGQIGDFIDNLSGFYEGTDTTLGEALGERNRINRPNEKDTHIIKAHKDEMIIGVDKMKKLPNGITQDEVVNRVLLAENLSQINQQALRVSVNGGSNDELVKEIKAVKESIKNIDLPSYQFNYDEVNKMIIETVKTKGLIVNNKKKIGGLF